MFLPRPNQLVPRSQSPFFRPPRAAFTLVEALIAISITAIAASALLLGTTTSLQATRDAQNQTIAVGMAQHLMDEVLGNAYMDPGGAPYATTLGPESGETSKPGRQLFDDIDDFNGQRTQPPKDRWGVALGTDDGQGGMRHPNFRVPAGLLDNWRQEIDVYYVNETNLTTRLPAGQTSDYRAVEVRIMATDPDGRVRELAKVRRVVAYVPPLP
jgi:type II secretory pathway pseudopilin PulG